MRTTTSVRICFSGFTLDPQKCSLAQFDNEIKLRPRAFDVLCYLVEHHGRVVPKKELIDSVWRGTYVTDGALVQCIRDIRAALDDNDRQLIKTIPRRGSLFSPVLSPEQGHESVFPHHEDKLTSCLTQDDVKIAMAIGGNWTSSD